MHKDSLGVLRFVASFDSCCVRTAPRIFMSAGGNLVFLRFGNNIATRKTQILCQKKYLVFLMGATATSAPTPFPPAMYGLVFFGLYYSIVYSLTLSSKYMKPSDVIMQMKAVEQDFPVLILTITTAEGGEGRA